MAVAESAKSSDSESRRMMAMRERRLMLEDWRAEWQDRPL
jgi:hypothetical protein